MPQDGSNNYQYPPGTPGIPDTTIESESYNTFLDDLVVNDLNIARPIHRGGTGALNAHDAMINLSGEIAKQVVTNYDSFPFVNGSFYSAPGATSAPNPTNRFAGIYYANSDDSYATLEARDQTTGILYVKKKVAGVWDATWSEQPGSSTDLDARYVNVTGDTMSGDLVIAKSNPIFTLNAAATTGQNVIFGDKTGVGVHRWAMVLGNNVVESAVSTGSDFAVLRYNNSGTIIDTPLTIVRDTGELIVQGPLNINYTQAFLRVDGTAGCGIAFEANNVPRWTLLGFNDMQLVRFNDAGASLGAVLNVIRATGNIGITTTTNATSQATGALQVSGGIGVLGDVVIGSAVAVPGLGNTSTGIGLGANGYIAISRSSGPTMFVNSNVDAPLMSWLRGGVNVGSVSVTTTATAYNTSSDERLKTDLKSFEAGHIIDDTMVYDFKWKETGERAYGVIAQQAKEVYATPTFHDEKEDRWFIDYSKYVPVILQELKALRARVAELEGTA